jgi:hypothetical protein
MNLAREKQKMFSSFHFSLQVELRFAPQPTGEMQKIFPASHELCRSLPAKHSLEKSITSYGGAYAHEFNFLVFWFWVGFGVGFKLVAALELSQLWPNLRASTKADAEAKNF